MSVCDSRPDLAASTGLPVSAEGEPAFVEPWQAQAFAMTVALYEKGVFTWAEWASTLSRETGRRGRAAEATPHGSPIRLENAPR